MTKEERDTILREFQEAKALVEQLDRLTHRIERAADRAIEVYGASQGDENGTN